MQIIELIYSSLNWCEIDLIIMQIKFGARQRGALTLLPKHFGC